MLWNLGKVSGVVCNIIARLLLSRYDASHRRRLGSCPSSGMPNGTEILRKIETHTRLTESTSLDCIGTGWVATENQPEAGMDL